MSRNKRVEAQPQTMTAIVQKETDCRWGFDGRTRPRADLPVSRKQLYAQVNTAAANYVVRLIAVQPPATAAIRLFQPLVRGRTSASDAERSSRLTNLRRTNNLTISCARKCRASAEDAASGLLRRVSRLCDASTAPHRTNSDSPVRPLSFGRAVTDRRCAPAAEGELR